MQRRDGITSHKRFAASMKNLQQRHAIRIGKPGLPDFDDFADFRRRDALPLQFLDCAVTDPGVIEWFGVEWSQTFARRLKQENSAYEKTRERNPAAHNAAESAGGTGCRDRPHCFHCTE
jgi:hypothetical protein